MSLNHGPSESLYCKFILKIIGDQNLDLQKSIVTETQQVALFNLSIGYAGDIWPTNTGMNQIMEVTTVSLECQRDTMNVVLPNILN